MEWYSGRWDIEVYHRTLKSGCRIKDRQLGTADRLETCLGVDMVVAWRIYHLTMLGRETPEMLCTVFFKDMESKESDMIRKPITALCLPLSIIIALCWNVRGQDAQDLVEASFNYMRGAASVSTVDMTIHRPDWERVMTMKAWTKGQKDSLFQIIAPPKDHGNGTLKKGREMWIYNPKVNRVIKLPPSMMSQAWMGSDFSNNDLSKTDSLINDYSHTIMGTETHEGKKVFLIRSMPKPEAAVVWGMQRLKIREDHIFLSQEFYDEYLKLVKAMTTLQIQMLSGKLFPKVWKMQKADVTDEYTELEYRKLAFEQSLPDSVFTLSNLRNPRR